MKTQRYLALLRGINVGGKNIIKMSSLQKLFEGLNLKRVSTYIQSGNVLFETTLTSEALLTKKIEHALTKQFHYDARIVLISHQQLTTIVKKSPRGFGKDTSKYRCDVIFLKSPVSAIEAIKQVTTKPGVDTAAAKNNVLYFSRLAAQASRSHVSRIIKLPIYQSMTIRNWNTTTRLLARMDEMEQLTTDSACSRGHQFVKNTTYPVCPKCWPGYYRKLKARAVGKK
jgi:uncharacterized protein (DUF1697 family)